MTESDQPPSEVVLALSQGEQRFVLIAGLLGGAAVGLAGHWIWPLVEGWPLPLKPLWRLLFVADSAIGIAIVTGLGGAIGLVGGAAVNILNPVVIVGPNEVTIHRLTSSQTIPRGTIGAVEPQTVGYLVTGPAGETLYKGAIEGGEEAVAGAFRRFGYPWQDRKG